MKVVSTVDISDCCVNLLPGRYLHIKHRIDGSVSVQFGLSNKRSPSGFLRNLPATADAQVIRNTLNSDFVKIHEIAGILLDTLVMAIINSRPVNQN